MKKNKIYKKPTDYAKQFLLMNGFKKIEKNSYANNLCNVAIELRDNHYGAHEYYSVADNNGYTMYSSDINIYWLIGVLTFKGFINKNYKQWKDQTQH